MFFANTLNYRGTTVAVTDYALMNQALLNNQSVIGYDQNVWFGDGNLDNTLPDVVNSLREKFEVIPCTWSNINHVCEQHKIDKFYVIRGGWSEPLPDVCDTMVHTVFNIYEPHGNHYYYVSEWLSNQTFTQHHTHVDHVNHMVCLPPPNKNLRTTWQIPDYAKVIGRHGGFTTFDIPWVKHVINRILEYRLDYYFVFLGTEPWIRHPRVIFLDPESDSQFKSNYINSCDVMLHARLSGESFGMSIAEFLWFNKPVLTWQGGPDQNHTHMLKNSPLIYQDAAELEFKLNNWYCVEHDWISHVQPFHPNLVMNKLNSLFLGK